MSFKFSIISIIKFDAMLPIKLKKSRENEQNWGRWEKGTEPRLAGARGSHFRDLLVGLV